MRAATVEEKDVPTIVRAAKYIYFIPPSHLTFDTASLVKREILRVFVHNEARVYMRVCIS